MNLRTKLLIGYLVFVAALAVLGVWSAWHSGPGKPNTPSTIFCGTKERSPPEES